MQSPELIQAIEVGSFIDYKDHGEVKAFEVLNRDSRNLAIKEFILYYSTTSTVDASNPNIFPFRMFSSFKEDAFTYRYPPKEFNKQHYQKCIDGMNKFINSDVTTDLTIPEVINLVAGHLLRQIARVLFYPVVSKQQMDSFISFFQKYRGFLKKYLLLSDPANCPDRTKIYSSHEAALGGCMHETLFCLQELVFGKGYCNFMKENAKFIPENFETTFTEWMNLEIVPILEAKKLSGFTPVLLEKILKVLIETALKAPTPAIFSLIKKVVNKFLSFTNLQKRELDSCYFTFKKIQEWEESKNYWSELELEMVRVTFRLYMLRNSVFPLNKKCTPEISNQLNETLRGFKNNVVRARIIGFLKQNNILTKLCQINSEQYNFFKYFEVIRSHHPEVIIDAVANSGNIDLVKKYIPMWSYNELSYAANIQIKSQTLQRQDLFIAVEYHKQLSRCLNKTLAQKLQLSKKLKELEDNQPKSQKQEEKISGQATDNVNENDVSKKVGENDQVEGSGDTPNNHEGTGANEAMNGDREKREKLLIDLTTCMNRRDDTKRRIQELNFRILRLAEKWLEVDAKTVVMSYFQNHVVNRDISLLQKCEQSLRKQPRSSQLYEGLIVPAIIHHLHIKVFLKLNEVLNKESNLTAEQKQELLHHEAENAKGCFQGLCQSMKVLRPMHYLQKRKHNLGVFFWEINKNLPLNYTLECMYSYIEAINNLETKESRSKTLDFVMQFLKNDGNFPNQEEKIKIYKRVAEIMQIGNEALFQNFQYIIMTINQQEGRTTNYKEAMLPQVIHQAPFGIDLLFKCLDDEARLNDELRNHVLRFILKMHTCRFDNHLVETEMMKKLIEELMGGIEFGAKPVLNERNLAYVEKLVDLLLNLLKNKTGAGFNDDQEEEEMRDILRYKTIQKKSRTLLEQYEKLLGTLHVSFLMKDFNEENFEFELKADYTLKQVKAAVCNKHKLLPLLTDMHFNGRLIQGEELEHSIVNLFSPQYEEKVKELESKQDSTTHAEEGNQNKGKRPMKKSPNSYIKFTLEKNSNQSDVVDLIMKHLDCLYLRLPITKEVWERLPISSSVWQHDSTLAKSKKTILETAPPPECFLDLSEEAENTYLRQVNKDPQNYFEWKEVLGNEYKKKIMLKFYRENSQKLNPSNFRWLIKAYSPVHSALCIHNNQILIQILRSLNLEPSKQEAIALICDSQIAETYNAEIQNTHLGDEYRRMVTETFVYLLETIHTYCMFSLLMELDFSFVVSHGDRVTIYHELLRHLWAECYKKLPIDNKISFFQNSMFTALLNQRFVNFRWFIYSLNELPKSQENTKIFQIGMFESIKFLVGKGSEKEIIQIKASSVREELYELLLEFIWLAIQNDGNINSLRNSHQNFDQIFDGFINFLSQNFYTSNGSMVLTILGHIAGDRLLYNYVNYFHNEMEDPLWMERDVNRNSKRVNTRVLNKFVGLRNPHSVCYMNSFIQQLFHIKQFRNGIFATDWKKSNDSERDDVMYQVKKTFLNLKFREIESYLNEDFFNAFKDYEGQPTNVEVQMDVDEFRNILLDRLENVIVENKKEAENRNFIQRIFNGKQATIVTGRECDHVSRKEEQFSSICLQVKGLKLISHSLKNYFSTEVLEGENCYYCDECKKKVTADKSIQIIEYPPYLTFVLKRFEYRSYYREKVNSSFQFPLEELEIAPGVSYTLKGIIIHQGLSEAGHYFSLIKIEGKWYEFNDQSVEDITEKQVKYFSFGDSSRLSSRNAYVLFYEKIKKDKSLFLEDPGVCYGLEKEQEEIDRINNNLKKASFYYSEHFKQFLQTILLKNIPGSFELLFEYTLLIKAKSYTVDVAQFASFIEYLKPDIPIDFLKSDKEVGWVLRFYQSKHLNGSIKNSLNEVLIHNYRTLTKPYQLLLEESFALLPTDNETSQFFNLYYGLSKKDPVAFKFLIDSLIVGRILNITFLMLGADREQFNKLTSIPFTQPSLHKRQSEKPDLKYHKWKFLNLILQEDWALNPKEQELLMKTSPKKFKSMFEDVSNKAGINQIAKFCQILSQKSESFTLAFLGYLGESMTRERSQNLRKYLKVCDSLLKIDDSLKDMRMRDIKTLFSRGLKEYFQMKNQTGLDILWQWLIKICRKNEEFRYRCNVHHNEFDLLLNRNLTATLFLYRGDYYIRNQDKLKNRYNGLKFPFKNTQSAQLYNEKMDMTKKILDPTVNFKDICKTDEDYDSDADLTAQEAPIVRNSLIAKYDEKLSRYVNIRVREVCGDQIVTNEDHKIDRGDERFREALRDENDNQTEMDAEYNSQSNIDEI